MDVEREFSCGGVVVRGSDCIVIVPRRRAVRGGQVLALTKGHPENGELPADIVQFLIDILKIFENFQFVLHTFLLGWRS